MEYASKILQNDLKLLNLLHYYYNFPENKKEDRENQKWFEERMKILDILIQKILT